MARFIGKISSAPGRAEEQLRRDYPDFYEQEAFRTEQDGPANLNIDSEGPLFFRRLATYLKFKTDETFIKAASLNFSVNSFEEEVGQFINLFGVRRQGFMRDIDAIRKLSFSREGWKYIYTSDFQLHQSVLNQDRKAWDPKRNVTLNSPNIVYSDLDNSLVPIFNDALNSQSIVKVSVVQGLDTTETDYQFPEVQNTPDNVFNRSDLSYVHRVFKWENEVSPGPEIGLMLQIDLKSQQRINVLSLTLDDPSSVTLVDLRVKNGLNWVDPPESSNVKLLGNSMIIEFSEDIEVSSFRVGLKTGNFKTYSFSRDLSPSSIVNSWFQRIGGGNIPFSESLNGKLFSIGIQSIKVGLRESKETSFVVEDVVTNSSFPVTAISLERDGRGSIDQFVRLEERSSVYMIPVKTEGAKHSEMLIFKPEQDGYIAKLTFFPKPTSVSVTNLEGQAISVLYSIDKLNWVSDPSDLTAPFKKGEKLYLKLTTFRHGTLYFAKYSTSSNTDITIDKEGRFKTLPSGDLKIEPPLEAGSSIKLVTIIRPVKGTVSRLRSNTVVLR